MNTYRILKKRSDSDKISYGIYEVFYDEEGGVSYSNEPVVLSAPSLFQLKICCQSLLKAFDLPAIETMDELKFQALKKRYHNATCFLSSVDAIRRTPSYREIVASGVQILPFIYQEMKTGEAEFSWFYALYDILGSIPSIPEESLGKVKEINAILCIWLEENYADKIGRR